MSNIELAKAHGAIQQYEALAFQSTAELDAFVTAVLANERARGVIADFMQESSYRAGAKAGYNLGVDENSAGLAALLAAHEYPRSAAPQAPTPPAAMVEENQRLRQIVSGCVKALGTAAFAAPDCSLAFMESIPAEIEATVKHLRAAPPAAMVPLSDEALDDLCEKAIFGPISYQNFARAIEAAHGIGNQGAQEGTS